MLGPSNNTNTIKRQNKNERFKVIINYLKKYERVNILESDFVDYYIKETCTKFHPQPYGAHSCPGLGKDLGDMYKKGFLERTPVGLPEGIPSMGFPKWVYSYKLKTEE